MLVALRDDIAAGLVSARVAVQAAVDRLTQLHRRTNCVAEFAPEALDTARALDDVLVRNGAVGPLHGVPFTVKDWIDVAGLRCTGGYVEHAERRPERDATVVARCRAAGAIVVAKTNVQVDSEVGGVVRNPHDPTLSPGGSSSGEAAAVGGGASPFGLASDSGGSIRLPAAWCGAAGLKPTARLVPTTGHFPRVGDRYDGRTQIGPIAATADDLALVLSVIAGPNGLDGAVAPVALGRVDAVDIATLRVARAAPEPEWPGTPELAAAVDGAVAAVRAAGATVVDDIPLHLSEALDVTRRYWRRRELTGEEVDRQLSDWDRYSHRMMRAAAGVDVIVAPVTLEPAPPHREMRETDYVYTLPASLTGWPAVTVPVGDVGGRPVAVQVMARPWQDHVALAAAKIMAGSRR